MDLYAQKENKNKKPDGRQDTDAKYGIKEKYYKDDKGNEKILNRTETATADKGYDDQKTLTKLEKRGIIPIIDKRKMVKEEKEIKRTVYYDDLGNVYCYCPCTGVKREMAFDGYDKQRDSLAYKCPAKAYGIKCKTWKERENAKFNKMCIVM